LGALPESDGKDPESKQHDCWKESFLCGRSFYVTHNPFSNLSVPLEKFIRNIIEDQCLKILDPKYLNVKWNILKVLERIHSESRFYEL
jgi:hypothetical protein